MMDRNNRGQGIGGHLLLLPLLLLLAACSPDVDSPQGAAGEKAQPVVVQAKPRKVLEYGLRPRPHLVPADKFDSTPENPLMLVSEAPVSLFPLAVDDGSYRYARRLLAEGRIPVPDAIRTEEWLNAFDYAYPLPDDGHSPLRVQLSVSASPWHEGKMLVHIGIKGMSQAQPQVIAEDVLAQLVFDPATVRDYRLLGSEGQQKTDLPVGAAGVVDIEAGHTVTTLYEITPQGAGKGGGEFGVLSVRYRLPGEDELRWLEVPFGAGSTPASPLQQQEADFATAVAGAALFLKSWEYTGDWTLKDAQALAQRSLGDDVSGERAEFVSLLQKVKHKRGSKADWDAAVQDFQQILEDASRSEGE